MDEADPGIARFEALLEEARPPSGGVPSSQLLAEVAPLLPLLDELPKSERATGDLESFAFRECFTILTLLGRRLALLDLTPTSTLQIVTLALRATQDQDTSPATSFEQCAVAAAFEGFVLGREERVLQLAQARSAKMLTPVKLADGVYALLPSGVHDPEVLSECVDALGRLMLDAAAEIVIVDFSQLGEPSRDRAAAMFAADEVARMLGAVCYFSGAHEGWRSAAIEAHVSLEALNVVPTLADALAAARVIPCREKKKGPPWGSLFRRFAR